MSYGGIMIKMNNILAQEKGLINNDDRSLYNKLCNDYKYLLEYYFSYVLSMDHFGDTKDI